MTIIQSSYYHVKFKALLLISNALQLYFFKALYFPNFITYFT